MVDRATFVNIGDFSLSSDAGIEQSAESNASNTFFFNAGAFGKTAGTGPSRIGPRFINSENGTLNAIGGTLRLESFPTNAGVINTVAGATLTTRGASLVNEATGAIRGYGTIDVGTQTLTHHGRLIPGIGGAGSLAIAGNLN